MYIYIYIHIVVITFCKLFVSCRVAYTNHIIMRHLASSIDTTNDTWY